MKLQEAVRNAAQMAEMENQDDSFDAMSWLDGILEDTPHSFDYLFEKPWSDLTDSEKNQRAMEIRTVL